MNEPIIELMNRLGMTPTQFSTVIGASRTTIQHIINGRNEPSLKLIKSILEKFPSVDMKWLLNGEGSAFTNQSQITDYPLFENNENLIFQQNIQEEQKNHKTYIKVENNSQSKCHKEQNRFVLLDQAVGAQNNKREKIHHIKCKCKHNGEDNG